MTIGRRIRVIVASAMICGLPAVSRAQAPQIWASPPDPFSLGPVHWRDMRPDYLQMFGPDAPWADAARKVSVYKVSPSLVDYAPSDVLRTIFADLQRRGFALAWEMGAVPPGTGCGTGTEGYAGDTARSVQRIKAAGGQLRYVAMDEPYWYGHYAKTAHSCQLSVEALAQGVAERLKVVRAVFPDVEVGDIEPVGNPPDDGYTDKLVAWAQAFRAATGKPLAFIHADVNWKGIWRQQLPEFVEKAKALKIPSGVIINGDPAAGSNEGWVAAAIIHQQQVVDVVHVKPDQLIFQSWEHLPTRVVPEQSPGTMTNLILQGSRPSAQVSLTVTHGNVSGRIVDQSGRPVANAKVMVTASDTAGVAGMHEVKVNGVAPPEAATAMFGLRVGTECDCSGPINVSLGAATFSDGGNTVVHRPFQNGPAPLQINGGNQKLSVNTPPFAVQPGRPYTVDVPLRVREQPTRPGYLGLFFFNRKGAEIRRVPVEFRAEAEPVGSAVTDANGAFSLPASGNADLSKFKLRAQVDGTGASRPTIFETAPKAE